MTILRNGLIGVVLLALGSGLGGYAVLAWEQTHRQPDEPAALPPRCWEAVVYLPLTDNDGKQFSEADVQGAIGLLVNDFGGATLTDRREGYWLDANQQLRREPVRPVIVSFARERLDHFRRSVREVGRRLGQECMYVRLEEPRVELIPVAVGGAEKQP